MNSNTLGMITDIQRFSLHDGPGIRTTVFLKGCPLNCKWCHNPEAISYKPQIAFNIDKCINCFECIKVCPTEAQQIENDKHVLQYDLCNACGDCINACYSGALRIYGKEKTVGDTLNLVLKDKNYYEASGGGLTISGGEPMTQFKFTKELLKRAKENGIHTCIETCGFATYKKYSEILSYVDLFLFDYKETDPGRHKDYTGVSNELILKNLDLLLKNNSNVILRCPIIPDINDNAIHFNGIKKLREKYNNIKSIELMAYHNIGEDKAKQIGKETYLTHIETANNQLKEKWLYELKTIGCEEVSIG